VRKKIEFCPRCRKRTKRLQAHYKERWFFLFCMECDSWGPSADSPEEAIDAWNDYVRAPQMREENRK